MAGADYLIFDNVTGAIKNPTLDRLLTSTEWGDRILGKSQNVTLSNTTVPALTANNAQFFGDTLRRSLVLRLAPLRERPEERTFRIANLEKYVLDNRRPLLIAAMRILQWYVQSGRPQQAVRPMGSFEDWSALVRQAVIHAGLPDPWVTERATDAASSASEAFLRAWKIWDKTWTGSARQMVEAVFSDQSPAAKNLQDASLELIGSIGSKEGRPDAQALGNYLGRIQGRNFADLRVMRAEKRSASGFVWRLEEVAQTAKK
jgi:putative DNA primase/helicase